MIDCWWMFYGNRVELHPNIAARGPPERARGCKPLANAVSFDGKPSEDGEERGVGIHAYLQQFFTFG